MRGMVAQMLQVGAGKKPDCEQGRQICGAGGENIGEGEGKEGTDQNPPAPDPIRDVS